MRIHRFLTTALALSGFCACSGGGSGGGMGIGMPPGPPPPGQNKIAHVVIIFQENRSPDNLFQGLAGADIASSGLNSHGQVVPLVPVHLSGQLSPYDVDHAHIPAFVTEFNNGQMNGFDRVRINCPSHTCVNPTAYGYVPPTEDAPYFTMAQRYHICRSDVSNERRPEFSSSCIHNFRHVNQRARQQPAGRRESGV